MIKSKKSYSIVLLFFFLFIGSQCAFAQTINQGHETEESKPEDINAIDDSLRLDFNDPLVIQNLEFLADYLTCMAITNTDITKCNKLKSKTESFEKCCNDYNFAVNLFGEAVINKRTNVKSFKEKDFEKLANALTKEDPNLCSGIKDKRKQKNCIAIVNQDENLCAKGMIDCSDMINYVKALKQNNQSICLRIRDKKKMDLCRYYVSKDKNICVQGSNFRQFFINLEKAKRRENEKKP